jgi:hypothetical protein
LQLTEQHFTRAVGDVEKAAQLPAQQERGIVAHSGTPVHIGGGNDENSPDMQSCAGVRARVPAGEMTPTGFEPVSRP